MLSTSKLLRVLRKYKEMSSVAAFHVEGKAGKKKKGKETVQLSALVFSVPSMNVVGFLGVLPVLQRTRTRATHTYTHARTHIELHKKKKTSW
jgi:hypothetical protein